MNSRRIDNIKFENPDGWMSHAIFDVCCASLVKFKLDYKLDQTDVHEHAVKLANSYVEGFPSETLKHLTQDLLAAFSEGCAVLEKLEMQTTGMASNFVEYRKNYRRNGEKKSFFSKIGGTVFHQGKHDPQRVENFRQCFASYAVRYKNNLT